MRPNRINTVQECDATADAQRNIADYKKIKSHESEGRSKKESRRNAKIMVNWTIKLYISKFVLLFNHLFIILTIAVSKDPVSLFITIFGMGLSFPVK